MTTLCTGKMDGNLLSGTGKGVRPHSIRRKYSKKGSPLPDRKFTNCGKDSTKGTSDKALERKPFNRMDNSVQGGARDKGYIKDISTDPSENQIITPNAQSLPWTPHRWLILTLRNFTNNSLPFYLQALAHHRNIINQVYIGTFMCKMLNIQYL